MKNTVLKITAMSLFAAAMVALPTIAPAQITTNAPTASDQAATAKKAKKDSKVASVPFNGKVVAVDTNAMTLTVGKRKFEISSETKITKDGQPATLADAVVGEKASGAYKKSEDGKLNATTVSYTTKAEKKKKKADEGAGGTAATK